MKYPMMYALLCFVFLPFSQVYSTGTQTVRLERFQKDVKTLSSEEMKGREAGSGYDLKAAEYIKEQMQQMTLQPLFGDSYFQPFEFYGEWSLGDDNFLVIGTMEAEYGKDVFSLSMSASGGLRLYAEYVGFGLETEEYNDYADRNDLEGKIFIMEYFLPESMDARGERFDRTNVWEKVTLAEEKGAAGVIFVNTESWRNDPGTNLINYSERADIPVVFAKREIFEYWQQHGSNEPILMSVDLQRDAFQSVNVAGYIDNNAEMTVVLGAHFDHLGMGGGSSRALGAEAVHAGADDNASGVAMKLELTRTLLTDKRARNHNYVIIAFSAEEKGLQGSQYFVNSSAYDLEKVNYMLNFDMVGRLEADDLVVLASGTSPTWNKTITDCATKTELSVTRRGAGVAGSDHANFYLNEIPVLFFFTGLHSDYHTPGDTYDKIDYEGMLRIFDQAYCMINTLEGEGILEFAVPDSSRRRRN